ncbi:MAG: metal-sensitive transcriptional regulator [Gulosibacter sp.]|uniref:metal-sensitive transcriptional regulator n=1 Tax=Gulosibacter sp. TaxID=2817531 RepID=UPI003F930A3B
MSESMTPGHAGHETHQHGYQNDVQALKNRLKRIEGQVRGVERMVEEDAYCIDVITQISAVKAGLDRVAMLLLEDHLEHCVADAATTGDPEFTAVKIQEVTDVVKRLLK